MKLEKRTGKAQWVAFNGILAATAIVLSALEAMLPQLPFLPPGAKIGLSNIVTMFAAGNGGLLPALFIAILKGLFAGMTRGLTSMAMSLAGGICSTFIMWLAFRKWNFGLLGTGVLGALFHNGAQLLVACALTSKAVFLYGPILFLMSILTGMLTGLVLRCIFPLLEKIRKG
jgi:heptaprenyl diphosphate synthase